MPMKYDKVIRIPSYELEREMKREYDIEINIKKPSVFSYVWLNLFKLSGLYFIILFE